MSWLEKIQSPADLKGLRLEALQEVAGEIRQAIAQTCSRNGGHFAPSLGVVELTIALHYVLDTPQDRLLWDVGHQTYPHKLLTGRADRFHTLRQKGGLSGFLKRDESPYDSFGAGHASTSISAALGMALARDQRGEKYRVVAVCGDGAMSGGLCYEALNNLGYLRPDMLIVLNDNKMSISPNIGAMARYFNQLITTSLYNKSKETAEDLINRVGPVGKKMVDFSQRLERTIKNLIVPEETIFEKMGIRYLGPIDGHDLRTLIPTLEHIRDLKGPILLHVKTIKGKGYPYSESDPERWHSGADFEVSTGKKTNGGVLVESPPAALPVPSYSEVFGRTLAELARKDERMVAITAAMQSGTGLTPFAQEFPERFFDVGIAEAHAVCCAAGMACDGLRPVVAVYSSFLQRAFDQVIHDVALQRLPVTFALDRAGLVGDDGPTHHGVFDLSYLRMIPGMAIMAPRNGQELRKMMAAAALYDKGPIAYRYPRGACADAALDQPIEPIPIGKGEVLREPWNAADKRVAILTVGTIGANALAAAQAMEQNGVGTAVADMRFVKPLDLELLARLADEYELLVTLEENAEAGGFGEGVNEALASMRLSRRALVLAIPDRWVDHGTTGELLAECGLDPDSIVRRILAALELAQGEFPRSRAAAK